MRTFASVLVLACLTACATPLASYSPVGAEPGMVFYQKNVPATYSVAPGSRVVVEPPNGADATQRPVFTIGVMNTSDAPITVGVDSVSARTNDGRALQVIPPEQLMREAQRRAFMTRFGAALQAAGNSMQAANAGYSNSYGTFNGTASAYGSGGYASGSFSGSYAGTQYNAAAAAQAQQAANAENARIASQANSQASAIMAGAQDGALQRETVLPGGQFMTPVTIDRIPSDATGIVLTVTIGAEVHEFQWAYSRQ